MFASNKKRDTVERLVLALHSEELRALASYLGVSAQQPVPSALRLRLTVIEAGRAQREQFVAGLGHLLV